MQFFVNIITWYFPNKDLNFAEKILIEVLITKSSTK